VVFSGTFSNVGTALSPYFITEVKSPFKSIIDKVKALPTLAKVPENYHKVLTNTLKLYTI